MTLQFLAQPPAGTSGSLPLASSHWRWGFAACLGLLLAASTWLGAQTVTSSVQGRVYDSTGAAISGASVTAVNTDTGVSRTTTASGTGDYQITLLPPGDYTVTAEKSGFQKSAKKVHLALGAVGTVDFSLAVGQLKEVVTVQDVGEVAEPTRTMVSSVIDEQKIQDLPVNGRQFIDFALLAPGVKIGDTTSGSTDVIIEPVTKLSFAGQNIHYNFIAVDGADNISTASGVQKYTPSQEAVREFRVINSSYSTEFGRAVGGIVNIITKSGTNGLHGSVYEYFRNDKLDAGSILASPDLNTCAVPGDPSSGGCKKLNKLRQNQFGFTLGGPVIKSRTFFFANYEGQRRRESPYYNSIILNNLTSINDFETGIGLAGENLAVTRNTDYNNLLLRVDHTINEKNNLFVRYFFNDGNLQNYSPLNDGFDLPSGFKNNSDKDHSIVGNLSTLIRPTLVNELRVQYAHRNYDFPTATSIPHMEVANQFAIGVNRGNPDFYKEGRFELVDSLTKTAGTHTLSFGGDYNWVRTTESFPLFYPFETTFLCINPDAGNPGSICNVSNLQDHDPVVIFFERFQKPDFNEPNFDPAVFQLKHYPDAVRNAAVGTLDHTYSGVYGQDNWRATQHLTVNLGVRTDWETWPSRALNTQIGVDPRLGIAYSLGTSRNVVVRAGIGLFHGIVPAPLLACQVPSCGGQTQFRPQEDTLNSVSQLFGFASSVGPGGGLQAAFDGLVTTGTYPTSDTGFLGPATIVRFTKDHRQPYGIQHSLAVEFEPVKDTVLNISYLRTHGVHLGSFYNINQAPTGVCAPVHDSHGNAGCKPQFQPASANFLFFEADSRWYSEFDGLLINLNKRMTHHFAYGISYTWSKSLDDGPNPSFVLIPQNSFDFRAEKALSADHVAHRFVGNAIFQGPTNKNVVVNDWQFSTIISFESPHYFTKFAGLDTNGDGFPINDRVGIEPRDTFKGDSFQSVDLRISRTFKINERLSLQGLAESFNTLNTVNVRFFNTVYTAPDFIPVGTPGTFTEGSPNPSYGTPRAVFNPRQIQFALRLTW
ncbi:MAG: carboxypeptidase regulatory-like domain-containing protein [Terriglobales bacterium]